jgi:hypothetical protein
MRNIIFGGIGVLWGGGILLYSFLGSAPRAQGAYGAGQSAATLFGLLLFIAGLFYLITGIRAMSRDEPVPKTQKRKKKKKQIEEDD